MAFIHGCPRVVGRQAPGRRPSPRRWRQFVHTPLAARAPTTVRVTAQTDPTPTPSPSNPSDPSDPSSAAPDPDPSTSTQSNNTPPTTFAETAQRLGVGAFADFLDSLQLRGRWEHRGGNYILRPHARGDPNASARAVVHFLGGAFVGAAPHISYRYMLEQLAARGYVIVATPFQLKFDYLEMVDDILKKFDSVSVGLALDYGSIPVVGVGHSAGALLQVVTSSLFPDAERAGNVLISYNSKPVTEAIPLFKEAVTPIAAQTKTSTYQSFRERALKLGERLTGTIESIASSPLVPPILEKDVLPLTRESLKVVEQIEPLFDDVANGTTEFYPTPEDVRQAAEAQYATPVTLLVRFSNDSLDQSPSLGDLLRTRSEVELKELGGSHVTPLATDPFAFRLPFDDCVRTQASFVREPVRMELLREVNRLVDEISEWIDGGISSGML